MRFENREIPETGSLVALLREEARRSFILPPGEEGDQTPLDWVGRLMATDAAYVPRVREAYLELLLDPDPAVARVVLQQVASFPISLTGDLFDLVRDHGSELASLPDIGRTDGQSLLGAVIRVLVALRPRAVPTPKAVPALAGIMRPEDGWPEAFFLALLGDLGAHLPQLIPTLAQMNPDQLAWFARAMVVENGSLTTRGFEAIGQGPPDLRDAFAALVKRFVEESDRMRHLLAANPPAGLSDEAKRQLAAARDDRWPDFAARLGVNR